MAIAPRIYEQQTATRVMPLPEQQGPAPGAIIADAAGELGQAAQGYIRQADELKLAQARSDQAVRFAEMQAQQAQAEADARQNAGPGAAGYEEAMAKARDEAAETFMGSLADPRLVREFAPDIARWKASGSVNDHVFTIGKRTEKLQSDVANAWNLQGNNLRLNPDANLLALADEQDAKTIAGMPVDDDTKAKLQQAGRAIRGRAFLEGTPADQRLALLKTGQFNDRFEPRVMGNIITGAEVEIRQQQAQARAAQEASNKLAREQLATQEVELNAGRGTFDQWSQVAAGYEALGDTSKAAAARVKATEIAASEAYRGATPAERGARIAELAAKPSLSAAEGAELNGLQGQQRYVESLSTLQRSAYATGRAVAPLNINDEASIRQRMAAVSAARQQFGGTADFFLPEEVDQIKGLVTNGETADRVAAAMVIGKAGPFAGRALDQVSGNDANFRAAATLARYGEIIVKDALAGPEALKASPLLLTPAKDDAGQLASPRPNEVLAAETSGAAARMGEQFGAALSLNARNIYLSHAQKLGLTNFDPEVYRAAINTALGGVQTASGWAGGIGTVRGQKVILPRGMTEQQLERRIATATGADWGQASLNGPPWAGTRAMTSGEARSLAPVMVRDGIYALRHGNTFVTTKDGREYLFDARKLYDGPRISAGPSSTAPAQERTPLRGLGR